MALLVSGVLLFAAGCFDRIRGSGRSVTEQRDVPPFDKLEVRGAIVAEVTIGEPRSVAITGDDNVVPIIKTEVRDGRLVIEPEKSYRNASIVRATIRVPSLSAIDASGASTVSASGLRETALAVEASGASTVNAAGSADRVEADVSGASRLRLGDLAAREANLDVSGASSVEVRVSERLGGTASGASSVRYVGTPRVEVDTSGASSVRSR